MYRFDLNSNFSLEIENWIMSDPIIDIWSRKIETPHHGYWQGGYREDSHIKWRELKGRPRDRMFGPNDRTFLCRTQNFFVLHSMPMASFHIFVLLNDPHICSVIIGPLVK